jgi:hypothetical protein
LPKFGASWYVSAMVLFVCHICAFIGMVFHIDPYESGRHNDMNSKLQRQLARMRPNRTLDICK